MKLPLKIILLFLSLLLVLPGCQKDVTTAPTLTLQQVVANVIGYYTVQEICTQNNGSGGFTSDTSNNAIITISTADDTTIIMRGTVLSFAGSLATKTYSFYAPASGGGYNAQFDSTFHNIQFGISTSGLGGGGCGGSGSK